jgi:hypothetical protein
LMYLNWGYPLPPPEDLRPPPPPPLFEDLPLLPLLLDLEGE